MKRRVFKDWVIMLLSFINIICVFFISADFEDMLTFHLVHIVALLIFAFNSVLIIRHGKEDWFE